MTSPTDWQEASCCFVSSYMVLLQLLEQNFAANHKYLTLAENINTVKYFKYSCRSTSYKQKIKLFLAT